MSCFKASGQRQVSNSNQAECLSPYITFQCEGLPDVFKTFPDRILKRALTLKLIWDVHIKILNQAVLKRSDTSTVSDIRKLTNRDFKTQLNL